LLARGVGINRSRDGREGTPRPSPESASAIDAAVRAAIAKTRAKSLAIAVIEHGKPVFVRSSVAQAAARLRQSRRL
jgi:hypothetical protein